jgi:PKD repeat protein
MPAGQCNTAWTWTFGDATGGTSPAQNPTYQYADRGTYTVTLLVTNSAGTDTASHVVTVSP